MSKKKVPLREYLVAGGIAGAVSRTAIAPIERVMIIHQVGKNTAGARAGYWHLVPKLIQEQGVLSLWKGNSAAVIRIIPYMSITFGSVEQYKLSVAGVTDSKSLISLAGGALGGGTAVTLTYPLDLVRARMAVEGAGTVAGAGKPQGMFSLLKTIYQEEGAAALYRGMGATLAGVMPYAGLKFLAYDTIKRLACGWLQESRGDGKVVEEADLPGWVRSGAGATAGLAALCVVYPSDVIRRRMQTHKGDKPPYTGVVNALTTIAREEGVRNGLYRGLTLRCIRTVPNVAIYMPLYDFVKAWLVPPGGGAAGQQ
jgi:hypothetical protein